MSVHCFKTHSIAPNCHYFPTHCSLYFGNIFGYRSAKLSERLKHELPKIMAVRNESVFEWHKWMYTDSEMIFFYRENNPVVHFKELSPEVGSFFIYMYSFLCSLWPDTSDQVKRACTVEITTCIKKYTHSCPLELFYNLLKTTEKLSLCTTNHKDNYYIVIFNLEL